MLAIKERLVLKESSDKTIQSGWSLAPKVLHTLHQRREGKDKPLSTPYKAFNNVVPGFYGGDLVVLAGRPSMGKTAFAGSLAVHFASLATPVLFFSLEMSAPQIVGRILAGLSGMPPQKIQSGQMTNKEYAQLSALLEQNEVMLRHLCIVDSSCISAYSMTTIATEFRESCGAELGAIFIDYVQLMDTSGGSDMREREVAACSAAAKKVARELKWPVFLLSQLNRGVEMRSSKRPMLADLRESGAIEQDADIVAFLFRGDYYGFRDAVEGETEVIIAKHRNGPTGTARIYFDKERVSFMEDAK